MKNDISLASISGLIEPLKNFFAKHHPVLFISFISLLLAFAVYSLYGVLMSAQTTGSSPTTTSIGQFDQKTVDEIKQLHNSGDNSSTLSFPSPRVNPFIE